MGICIPLDSVAEGERETVDGSQIRGASAMRPADYVYADDLGSWITVESVAEADASYTFTASNGTSVIAKGTAVTRRKRSAVNRERASASRIAIGRAEPGRHPRGAANGFPRQDEYPARPKE
jgi:hypothetical protein